MIDISSNEVEDSAFVSLNPNGRILAITDPVASDGTSIAL